MQTLPKQGNDNMEIEEIIKIIKSVENPYPSDIFLHDNSEPKEITTGRFNAFVYDVVEMTRESIIEAILEGE